MYTWLHEQKAYEKTLSTKVVFLVDLKIDFGLRVKKKVLNLKTISLIVTMILLVKLIHKDQHVTLAQIRVGLNLLLSMGYFRTRNYNS